MVCARIAGSALRRLRGFFSEHGFLEVETPLLANEVIPELHIEPIHTADGAFLQASPELQMKRLLAAERKSIYQVTRSFRAGERGRFHNPEFTIVEWYRPGDDLAAGMDLLDDLMQSLLGTPRTVHTTYAEAFRHHAGLCPHTASLEALTAAARGPNSPSSILWGGASQAADRAGACIAYDRDELLNLLLATRIEPQLGHDRPEIIYHYPASQASLAKIAHSPAGYDVAERFELYYRGVELANGFHELADAGELRRRFSEVNAARVAEGRPALPLPESLLTAMAHGLPASAGVALGFDRLAMLAAGADSIAAVMPYLSI